MNHVLSEPTTAIVPGLLKPLKSGRHETLVSSRRTVRFELAQGPVEMGFLDGDPALEPGTRVYVWWKGGGFVCAPVEEVRAEEEQALAIAERVLRERERLQAARRARDTGLSDFDVLPPAPRTDHPLLQTGR
jgi:hypothetical protein